MYGTKRSPNDVYKGCTCHGREHCLRAGGRWGGRLRVLLTVCKRNGAARAHGAPSSKGPAIASAMDDGALPLLTCCEGATQGPTRKKAS